MTQLFTSEELESLFALGFEQNNSVHSGYPFFIQGYRTIVLVKKEDGYKLEHYEVVQESDDSWYTDFCSEDIGQVSFQELLIMLNMITT